MRIVLRDLVEYQRRAAGVLGLTGRRVGDSQIAALVENPPAPEHQDVRAEEQVDTLLVAVVVAVAEGLALRIGALDDLVIRVLVVRVDRAAVLARHLLGVVDAP
ncbi:MAG TPA: hypothetical protein DGT21_25270 [Armatimonadetes bacterium]|nr:hypothetical protein [Armatimonadota bacterium]